MKLEVSKDHHYLFDFDGVIIDSNEIKNDAFRETLADYPQNEINLFMRYHGQNHGISRFEKFEYFLTNITNDPKIRTKESLVEKFGEISKAKVLNAGVNSQAIQFLNFLKSNDCQNLYLISGTEESELKTLAEHFEVSPFFKKILGSPKKKVPHIEELNIPTQNAYFFGDGFADIEAAKHFNMPIYFLKQYTGENLNSDISSPFPRNIFQIYGHLLINEIANLF